MADSTDVCAVDPSPDRAARRPAPRPASGSGPGEAPETEKRAGGSGEGPRPPEGIEGELVSSNSIPSSNPISSGGEDWLELSLYAAHSKFEETAKLLDAARSAAEAKAKSGDEVELAGQRFLVSAGGANAGSGDKRIYYRWRLTGESGLVLHLMQRALPHATIPNALMRATSLQLMRDGLHKTWQDAQDVLAELGIEVVRNKLSRVDACADLIDVAFLQFQRSYGMGYYVMRPKDAEEQSYESHVAQHRFGREPTSFRVGTGGVRLRVYDKIKELGSDLAKLDVMVARRWGKWSAHATRAEFQLRRAKLKELGVDSVEDWIRLRRAICRTLTRDWFRLVDGPFDRKHPERAAVLPAWKRVQDAFEQWTGGDGEAVLAPLPTNPQPPVHLIKQAVGLLVSALARAQRPIDSNDAFFHEASASILDAIDARDMVAEIRRRSIELGVRAWRVNDAMSGGTVQ